MIPPDCYNDESLKDKRERNDGGDDDDGDDDDDDDDNDDNDVLITSLKHYMR